MINKLIQQQNLNNNKNKKTNNKNRTITCIGRLFKITLHIFHWE